MKTSGHCEIKIYLIRTIFEIAAALFLLSIMFSCVEYDLDRTNRHDPKSKYFIPSLPVLTTTSATDITSISATTGGKVNSDGGAPVSLRGVCWKSTTGPTTSNNKTIEGTGTGSFASSLTGLSVNTKYYVRAYAVNRAGTAYGNEVSFTTDPIVASDIDGNVYNVIRIGTQLWMKENLRTTKYNEGTSIPLVSDGTEWTNLSTPGYCWYENDETTYKDPYGAMYNWYAVNTDILCPTGWHVPNDDEFTVLVGFLGNEFIAGAKLKETGTAHWQDPNDGATNVSGFTALPGGRRDLSGSFYDIGYLGGWWSSSESGLSNAWSRDVSFNFTNISRYDRDKRDGFNVRCVKN